MIDPRHYAGLRLAPPGITLLGQRIAPAIARALEQMAAFRTVHPYLFKEALVPDQLNPAIPSRLVHVAEGVLVVSVDADGDVEITVAEDGEPPRTFMVAGDAAETTGLIEALKWARRRQRKVLP